MKDSIVWLISLEQRVAAFYRSTAALCAEHRPELTSFFTKLASDEDRHAEILQRYLAVAKQKKHPQSCILIDDATGSRIQSSLTSCESDLAKGDFSLGNVLNCLVDLEFSELNDIFLYTINLLSDDEAFIQETIREITEHRTSIENFIMGTPDAGDLSTQIETLRTPLAQRMLIVDDEAPIRFLLKAMFEKTFLIDTAPNGRDALDAVCHHYYDVVISDVDMPVMSGIEFLHNASRHDPSLSKRTIFFTGGMSDNIIRAIRDQHILFLLKPSPISDLEAAVHQIMGRTCSGKLKSRHKRTEYDIP